MKRPLDTFSHAVDVMFGMVSSLRALLASHCEKLVQAQVAIMHTTAATLAKQQSVIAQTTNRIIYDELF